METKTKTLKLFKRYCDRCEKYFRPSSKGTRICNTCLKKGYKLRLMKNRAKRELEKKEREKNAT